MVSVIIPNYNYARFLKKRIDSVINQRVRPDEIIFLDDCSQDNSLVLAKELLGASSIPFQIIANEENSGSVFAQWQKGLDHCRGDFIWIAEADDAASDRFLDKTLAAMEDPKVGISYCETAVIDEQNNIVDWNFYRRVHSSVDRIRWRKSYTGSGREEVKSVLAVRNTIPNVSAVLFRREAVLRAGGFYSEYKMSGDWDCYLRILRDWDLSYNHNRLNYQRFHSDRVTNNYNYSELQSWEAMALFHYLNDHYRPDPETLDCSLNTVVSWLKEGGPGDSEIIDFIAQVSEGLWEHRKIEAAVKEFRAMDFKQTRRERIMGRCRKRKI